MINSKKQDKCIQCGERTSLALDSGMYVCKNCILDLAKDMHILEEWLKNNSKKRMNLTNILEFLTILKETNFQKVSNVIDAINAFAIKKEYLQGSLNKETARKIEENKKTIERELYQVPYI